MATLSASLVLLSCVLALATAMPGTQTYPLKDCWFGDCTVTIGGTGSNTGTINGVRYGQTGQPGSGSWDTSRGSNFGVGSGANRNQGQHGVRPGQECSFGRCSVNIPGDNTEDIYLR
ncbi:hypothetical protein FOCC_FOCC015195 [Frankliniella occidentalis]|uniref:Uncharacterized protein LOC113212290 n=1 Tax=Frankliniella occidentalis TaxID=133901 RepID=A0A6J1SZK9_FRAOC|nr:uncharacterized protein LOC113212290 [Frankliniella occidentalis]KAE8739305.1 hypothetical protein FOCC_FOCC015195 [Frankliniella occidentalis]